MVAVVRAFLVGVCAAIEVVCTALLDMMSM